MSVDLRLYALVDPDVSGGHDLADLSRKVVAGGTTLVQSRDKHGSTLRLIEEARAIKQALAGSFVPLLVNDRVDVALAAGADGVHVGWDDMPVADARRLLGREAIIGLSIKTPEQVAAAPLELLDYVCIGGVFQTSSKDNREPPVRPDGFARLAAMVRARAPQMPIGAIAGIDESNAASVIAAGADGIAVISALSVTPDPEGAAKRLRAIVDDGLKLPGRGMTAIAVTIAGSDSGGGAGIQADLKTFSALGVYGASVIAALTAQNTKGVTGIHDVPAAFVTAQIDAVFSDLAVNAVKIGMLSNPETIAAVAAGLEKYKQRKIVLDPVMIAASGDRLLKAEAVESLRTLLILDAMVITPNLPEAAALLDAPMAQTESEMQSQGEKLLALGARAVLMKGGHGSGAESVDLLIEPNSVARLAAERVDTKNTHGTGCTLSSAVAAGLARGLSLAAAVREAKAYVTAAILASDRLKIGHGHGPVHHFHALWSKEKA